MATNPDYALYLSEPIAGCINANFSSERRLTSSILRDLQNHLAEFPGNLGLAWYNSMCENHSDSFCLMFSGPESARERVVLSFCQARKKDMKKHRKREIVSDLLPTLGQLIRARES